MCSIICPPSPLALLFFYVLRRCIRLLLYNNVQCCRYSKAWLFLPKYGVVTDWVFPGDVRWWKDRLNAEVVGVIRTDNTSIVFSGFASLIASMCYVILSRECVSYWLLRKTGVEWSIGCGQLQTLYAIIKLRIASVKILLIRVWLEKRSW